MEVGIVRQVDIDQEMRGAYLDYAMSVITARALPDVRDGLKPVQRRILFAMGDMGVRHNTPYRKCARIVGDVLGRYHPHGDVAIYDALARMAQDFSMRHPLVDGQGNFGSVDGDPPAAMRYTECRLTAVAEEMLLDIDKETVDFSDNFDATLKEPTVLPAKLPNLLINGAAGIAVGMATNIPPHNLREIADAVCYLIDHTDASVEDLGKIVQGPDFPTGGIIMGLEGIKSAYATGRGRILVRARAFIEDAKGERQNIIVTELPYQVNKAALQERIAELVKDSRIEGIADMRDESDRHGMRIMLELKKGADARTVLNLLYKYTAMQSTFGVNLLALVDGEPRVLTLKRILQHYIDYRHQVITRRLRFDLAKAKARAHILEGLKIALDHLDEVIATIRQSPDAETARTRLIKRFKLDDIQAQAILDMQLRRLARLERDKIEQELKEVRQNIAHLEDLLAHPQKLYGIIKDELKELREKYGDDRRTRILEQEAQEFRAEDLIADEDMVVSLTQKGYLKRYRLPRRTLRPAFGRETDPEREMCVANLHDAVLFVTSTGRVCGARCHELPEADRSSKGTPVGNLITLETGETVASLVPVPKKAAPEATLALVSRRARIKRVAVGEFSSARGGGVIGMSLDQGDSLVAARLLVAEPDLALVSRQGQVIRFAASEVRAMGRGAGGVAAMRLENDADGVVAFDLVRPDTHLLVLSQRGAGKRVAVSELPTQGRAGGGVALVKVTPKTGPVADARFVAAGDEAGICTSEGGQPLPSGQGQWRGPADVVAVKGRAQSLESVPELAPARGETITGLAVLHLNGESQAGGDEAKARGRKRPAEPAGEKIATEAGKRQKAIAKTKVTVPPAPAAAAGKGPAPAAAAGKGPAPAAPGVKAKPARAAAVPAAAPVDSARAKPEPAAGVPVASAPMHVGPARRKTAQPQAPTPAPGMLAGKRVIPAPPPVTVTAPAPRVAPRAPASPVEQMVLPLNGGPAVRAPGGRKTKAVPVAAPVAKPKPPVAAKAPAGKAVGKPVVAKGRQAAGEKTGSHRPDGRAAKAPARAKGQPTGKGAPAVKGAAGGKPATRPATRPAPKTTPGAKGASAAKPGAPVAAEPKGGPAPAAKGKPAPKPAEGDIIVRSQGGRVTRLTRDG